MQLSKMSRAALMVVFALSGLQLVGYVLQSDTIRGLGLISTASPLPFVFSAHDGLETFAQKYAVSIQTKKDAEPMSMDIDAPLYQKLGGSYNRRNAYGAVFSHGPIMAKGSGTGLIDSVVRFGFCHNGPLTRTFGLPAEPRSVTVKSRPNQPSKTLWQREVVCP